MTRRHTALPEPPPGPLGKLVALIAGATLLVLGFMFSIVLLAVVVAVGLCVWIYLWWKTRELRRVLREQQATRPATPEAETDGQIIEGEVIVVEERDPDPDLDRSPGHDR